MSLRVIAKERISSSAAGTGSVSSVPVPDTRSAAARNSSTGRSACPMTNQAITASTVSSTGSAIRSAVRRARLERSTSVRDTADSTHRGSPGRPGGSNDHPQRPWNTGEVAVRVDRRPVRIDREPTGGNDGGEPVGAGGPGQDAALGVHHLDDQRAGDREGIGQVAGVHQRDDLRPPPPRPRRRGS